MKNEKLMVCDAYFNGCGQSPPEIIHYSFLIFHLFRLSVKGRDDKNIGDFAEFDAGLDDCACGNINRAVNNVNDIADNEVTGEDSADTRGADYAARRNSR